VLRCMVLGLAIISASNSTSASCSEEEKLDEGHAPRLRSPPCGL